MLLNNVENKRSILLNISQLFIFVFIASESVAGNETDLPSVGQSASINNEKLALDSSSDTSSASNGCNALVIFKTKTSGRVNYLKKHKKPNENIIQKNHWH